ncbi:MAG TPA: L-histidine N(alpha)-methyltransferase [Pyrinomonadaceae bacterium]|jgi:dimethylhistidine N-methyltransferase
MIKDEPLQSDRLTLFRSSSEDTANTFSQDVLNGLTSSPKQLLPKYFYDKLGSRLFDAICYLPEYYVTRDEDEILHEKADQIIGESKISPQSNVNLIELGSGSSDKTRYLIEALLYQNPSLRYLPIDISLTSLEHSSKELLQAYPMLKITAYATDYFTALHELAKYDSSLQQTGQRNIAIFLGSSIGNLDLDESRTLLLAMRGVLQPEDSFFIGADLKKSTDILLPAYNDALGVTAAFNLNLLVRINRELEANFDLNKFEHRSIYNENLSRIEMHLFSLETQIVKIKSLDLEVHFDKGESIHTENSYKFDLGTLSTLALETGFHLTKTWFDKHHRFSFNLFTAIERD